MYRSAAKLGSVSPRPRPSRTFLTHCEKASAMPLHPRDAALLSSSLLATCTVHARAGLRGKNVTANKYRVGRRRDGVFFPFLLFPFLPPLFLSLLFLNAFTPWSQPSGRVHIAVMKRHETPRCISPLLFSLLPSFFVVSKEIRNCEEEKEKKRETEGEDLGSRCTRVRHCRARMYNRINKTVYSMDDAL